MGRQTRAALPRWLIGLAAATALQAGVFADGTHSIFDDNWSPAPSSTPATPAKPAPTPAPTAPTPAPAPDKHAPTPAKTDTPSKPAPSPSPTPAPGVKTPVQSPTPAAPVVTKYPPPDAGRQAETMKLVKEVFEKEYAAKAPEAKRQLAAALVGEAVKIKENYIARYVLLNEGYKAAIAGGDVADCKTAIDSFDKYYTVDSTALMIDTFSKFTSGPNGQNADLAAWGVGAVEKMVADDDYAQVRKLAKLVEASLPADADASMREKLKAAEMLAGEFERVRPSMTKLKTAPEDPAANFAVGKFYCFSKHDWDRGLPLLARGSDAKLKDLARQDLVEPSDAMGQYTLAGLWWGKDKTPLQAGMRERAIYWYKKAAPNLSGLQKVMAEKRSADQPAAEAENNGGAKNMLADVVDFAGQHPPAGILKVTGNNVYYAPKDLKPPFKFDIVVKTDAAISLRYGGGYVEFNFDPAQQPVSYWDPKTGDEGGIVDSTALAANQWTQLSWIVTRDTTTVYVNGKERVVSKGKYSALYGKLSFYSRGSVDVKSVNVTQGN